mgnify:CR=1 FL=1
MNNWIKTKISALKAKAKKILRKMPTFSEIEASPWISTECGPILKTDLKKNLFQCPKCNKSQRIVNARDRFDVFFGDKNYEIIDIPIDTSMDDPLRWVDEKFYIDRLKSAREKTKSNCAVEFAIGKLANGTEITCGAISFAHLGGSIGLHEGNAILAGIDTAILKKTPLVFFACGGGQRMYESAIALQQMTRTAYKIAEFKKTGLPYISVLVDPCFGGITASFATLGDINLSDSADASVGFAGVRIIKAQAPGEVIEDSFQKSSSLLKHGQIDAIIERKDLNEKIGNLLSILLKSNELKTIDEESEQNRELIKKTATST